MPHHPRCAARRTMHIVFFASVRRRRSTLLATIPLSFFFSSLSCPGVTFPVGLTTSLCRIPRHDMSHRESQSWKAGLSLPSWLTIPCKGILKLYVHLFSFRIILLLLITQLEPMCFVLIFNIPLTIPLVSQNHDHEDAPPRLVFSCFLLLSSQLNFHSSVSLLSFLLENKTLVISDFIYGHVIMMSIMLATVKHCHLHRRPFSLK